MDSARAFDFYDARPRRAPFRRPSPVFLHQPIATCVRESFVPYLGTYNSRGAAEIHSATLPVVDGVTRWDRPFLLFLNYMDVHRPTSLSDEWRDRFPGRDPDFQWDIDWQVPKDAGRRGRAAAERTRIAPPVHARPSRSAINISFARWATSDDGCVRGAHLQARSRLQQRCLHQLLLNSWRDLLSAR